MTKKKTNLTHRMLFFGFQVLFQHYNLVFDGIYCTFVRFYYGEQLEIFKDFHFKLLLVKHIMKSIKKYGSKLFSTGTYICYFTHFCLQLQRYFIQRFLVSFHFQIENIGTFHRAFQTCNLTTQLRTFFLQRRYFLVSYRNIF